MFTQTCNGVDKACPTDGFKASGELCRAASGDGCDVEEVRAVGWPHVLEQPTPVQRGWAAAWLPQPPHDLRMALPCTLRKLQRADLLCGSAPAALTATPVLRAIPCAVLHRTVCRLP